MVRRSHGFAGTEQGGAAGKAAASSPQQLPSSASSPSSPLSSRHQLSSSNDINSSSSNNNPVVASLTKRSAHPYSAVSLSPSRQHAVVACNDTLQILTVGSKGMDVIQTVPFAPHLFATPSQGTASSSVASVKNAYHSVLHRGLFEAPGSSSSSSSRGAGGGTAGADASNNPSSTDTNMMNVVINHVAWSKNLVLSAELQVKDSSSLSFIAAAGSNGTIAVWRVQNQAQHQQQQQGGAGGAILPNKPEVCLNQHIRAVNRVAWHPKRQMLLSASHDSTVRLWERVKVTSTSSSTTTATARGGLGASSIKSERSGGGNSLFPLFGGSHSRGAAAENYTWQCTGVFEPRSEPVRDIAWNPMATDVFALCTSSGSLVVYNRLLRAKPLLKLTAHDRDATTLDWHPTIPHKLATGGSNDRLVKVWNFQPSLSSLFGDPQNMAHNQGTLTSRASTHTDGSGGGGAGAGDKSSDSSHSWGSRASAAVLTMGSAGLLRQPPEHVLAVAAAVKCIRWRPPSCSPSPNDTGPTGAGDGTEDAINTIHGASENEHETRSSRDRHESMLAVATAPMKGETGSGSGLVALWSYHRPFMPLSVVEGHKDGAVVDFEWLDTPVVTSSFLSSPFQQASERLRGLSLDGTPDRYPGFSPHTADLNPGDTSMMAGNDNTNAMSSLPTLGGLWQHVLSVGKDGRCLIQSLARGERPISRVPPSCFAMANLSPFQSGYGSLQIFSVCQEVGQTSDFCLTGLRQDQGTALAPGIFREKPPTTYVEESNVDLVVDEPLLFPKPVRHRIPQHSPLITFNVTDQGELDHIGFKPVHVHVNDQTEDEEVVVVAPEVVHLSRYAALYVLYPTNKLPTRVHICLHNSQVASSLQNETLAHMWHMVAVLLESAGVDSLAAASQHQDPKNVIQFALAPAIHAILEERADDGDVQSCVALCEVLQVVNTDQTTQIPTLEIQLVREWYLSYIDLLRDMCLFSHACSVIRDCNDPLISNLNKQSTTISESCPQCGNPLLVDGAMEAGSARRICKSCRRRVGKCFLCHEPVRGMYVWCPGCGHGGHLEHALAWFGGASAATASGSGDKAIIRETCPTGCGHKCNVMRTVSAFPRTESLRDVVVNDSNTNYSY